MRNFEQYYYSALELLSDSGTPLRFNQIKLTGLDESFTKSVYDEMIENSYCEFNDNAITITEQGKQYLIDNDINPDKKPLHELILEYLKKSDLYGRKIDVAAPFLHDGATYQQRLDLVYALRFLRDDTGYINLEGNESGLCSTQAGRYTDRHHTGLKASLTEKGRDYINPKPPVVPIGQQFNLGNVTGSMFGNTVNQSALELNNLESHEPATSPTNTPKKISQYTLEEIASAISKWVIKNIWTIIIALIVAYLIFHFGWNGNETTKVNPKSH
jgi:hypothetical protein